MSSKSNSWQRDALFGYPLTNPIPQIAANGTIISGGGSVSNAPAYINTPFDVLQQRASDNDSTLLGDFINVNARAAVESNL